MSDPEPGCTCTRTFGGDGIAVRHFDCPVHGDRPVSAPEPTPYTPSDVADLGGLARVIDPAIYPDINRLTGDGWAASQRAASAVLRSRWLAAHDARVRAEARRDALNEAADVMSADTTLYADLEALCEKSANPSTLADQVQDAAAAWLRAAETPDGGA